MLVLSITCTNMWKSSVAMLRTSDVMNMIIFQLCDHRSNAHDTAFDMCLLWSVVSLSKATFCASFCTKRRQQPNKKRQAGNKSFNRGEPDMSFTLKLEKCSACDVTGVRQDSTYQSTLFMPHSIKNIVTKFSIDVMILFLWMFSNVWKIS